ncbi:hypothetical protein [Rickettsia endosymbiont of Orchestes rusci]|uniref:hypothetical protein n=1 Tax=Rickettsia endosymbiont of Orchestes rusci TaxID=3066250 RepID=UPI00313BAF06
MQQRRDCKERGNLENNKFHSIFCYFFLDCHVGTTSLLAMTIPVAIATTPRFHGHDIAHVYVIFPSMHENIYITPT